MTNSPKRIYEVIVCSRESGLMSLFFFVVVVFTHAQPLNFAEQIYGVLIIGK